MRKTLFGIGLLMFTIIGFAQDTKYGATPEDQQKCKEALSVYKDYIKTDLPLALKYWRQAYNICPQSQKSLYINGIDMYRTLIDKTKDEAQKNKYIDTLLSIYDKRIENFGQKGYVLGRKGTDVLRYRGHEEAFPVLIESMELRGNKTEAGVLVSIMIAVTNFEEEGKKSKEDVIFYFNKCSDIAAANVADDDKGYYSKALEEVQKAAAKYLDCETLIPIAEKGFESNKENVDWLKRTTLLLKSKSCFEAPIFGKVAEAYFNLEPSADGAEGMGNLFLGQKDFSKAIEFYQKALEMAENDEQKATFSFDIAKAYYYAHNYSSAKSYALKAAGYKSGWGEPYILIGDAYAAGAGSCNENELDKFGAYWAAVDKYQKAKSIDPSVAGDANQKIASLSAHYPSTQDVFFHGVKSGDSYTVGCFINETTTVRTK